MTRLRLLNLPQRVVLVVAVGGLLVLLGDYAVTKGFTDADGGWFAYAPGTTPVFSDSDRLGPVAAWLVRLGSLVIWTTFSLWLLAVPKDPPQPDA